MNEYGGDPADKMNIHRMKSIVLNQAVKQKFEEAEEPDARSRQAKDKDKDKDRKAR